VATVLEIPRVMRTQDNFIRTHTGRKFWPLDPRVEDVDIQDIAHALSLVCRWTGHTYCFYSVAEHSLRVSHLAEKMALADWRNAMGKATGGHDWARRVALWGLMHDASEAYLCDMPSPLKHATGIGQLYKAFEKRLMEVIAERYDLTPHMPAVVKDADRILLNTEARDLMDVADADAEEWRVPGDRLPETIFPMDAQHAEVEFMRRFEALTKAIEAERIADSLQ
jgi:5'-deoxynucleotidase YfbR-like HD superfamily hydrolase